LYEAAKEHKYGWADNWDALELISFARLLAIGPHVGLQEVVSDENESKDLLLLVDSLRGVKIYDAVGLLRESLIPPFVEVEDGHLVF
jgi:hypothetical protein